MLELSDASVSGRTISGRRFVRGAAEQEGGRRKEEAALGRSFRRREGFTELGLISDGAQQPRIVFPLMSVCGGKKENGRGGQASPSGRR